MLILNAAQRLQFTAELSDVILGSREVAQFPNPLSGVHLPICQAQHFIHMADMTSSYPSFGRKRGVFLPSEVTVEISQSYSEIYRLNANTALCLEESGMEIARQHLLEDVYRGDGNPKVVEAIVDQFV